MKFWLVIPAAGIGSRMASDRPKQYLQVAGKTILEHTLDIFLLHPQLQGAAVAVAEHDSYWPDLPLVQHPLVRQVVGGQERADSVLNALRVLPNLGAQPCDWVLVHDAARPLLQRTDLDRLLSTLKHDAVGGLLAYPARDTLKLADAQQRSQQTLQREHIWHALTPQMFPLQLLSDALEQALAAGVAITDEASAVEWAGFKPRLVVGRSDNLKITYPEDLQLLAAVHEPTGLVDGVIDV